MSAAPQQQAMAGAEKHREVEHGPFPIEKLQERQVDKVQESELPTLMSVMKMRIFPHSGMTREWREYMPTASIS